MRLVAEEMTLEKVCCKFLPSYCADHHTTSARSGAFHHLLSCATALTRQYIVISKLLKIGAPSVTFHSVAYRWRTTVEFHVKLQELKRSIRTLLSVEGPYFSTIISSLANWMLELNPIWDAEIGASVQMEPFQVSDFTSKYLWLLRFWFLSVIQYSKH